MVFAPVGNGDGGMKVGSKFFFLREALMEKGGKYFVDRVRCMHSHDRSKYKFSSAFHFHRYYLKNSPLVCSKQIEQITNEWHFSQKIRFDISFKLTIGRNFRPYFL